MQRYGSVLGLKEDKIEKYKELHALPGTAVGSRRRRMVGQYGRGLSPSLA